MWQISTQFRPGRDKIMTLIETELGNRILLDYDNVFYSEVDALANELISILNEPQNLERISKACQAVWETGYESKQE